MSASPSAPPLPSSERSLAELWLLGALFGVAFVVLGVASARFGIVDGEAAHLEAAAGYGRLIEAAYREGLLSLTRDDVARELGTARSFPVFPHGLAGLSWLVLARRTAGPLVSELFALRLPALLAAAAVPPLVFVLARERLGRWWALLAATFAFLGPRLLVDASSLGGSGPLVAASLLALLAHRRADRTGRLGPMVMACLALGCAVSQSFAPLLLLIVPLLRAWSARPASDGEDGYFRLSRGTLGWLAVGVPVSYLCSPAWQPLRLDVILAVFERTFSPLLTATRALGRLPTELAPPRWQAVEAVLIGVPSLVLAAAIVALVASTRGLSAVATSSRAVVRWAFVHTALLLLWPALVPRALASYPFAWQLAVPFLAIAAAHGARFLGVLCGREWLVAAACLLEPVVSSVDLPTAPAASGWLVPTSGRPRGTAPFDSAIVGDLVPTITGLGAGRLASSPLHVYAPDVAPETWEALHRWKRSPGAVLPVRQAKDADLWITTPDKPAPPGFVEKTRRNRGARTVLVVAAPR